MATLKILPVPVPTKVSAAVQVALPATSPALKIPVPVNAGPESTPVVSGLVSKRY